VSRFFVGQPVRVARNVGLQHPILNAIVGRESRVSGFTHDRGDGHVVLLRDFGMGVLFHPADLEPILPEGAAPSEHKTLAELLNALDMAVPA